MSLSVNLDAAVVLCISREGLCGGRSKVSCIAMSRPDGRRCDTNIGVPTATLSRFKGAKPWDSISHAEFLEHLLDMYEDDEVD